MADLGRRGKVLRGGGGDTTSGKATSEPSEHTTKVGRGGATRCAVPAPSDEQLDTSLDAQGPVRPP